MKKNSFRVTDSLLAAAYSPSAFERRINLDNYRERLHNYGEQIRWWKGYTKAGLPRENGDEYLDSGPRLYLEQLVPDDFRALFLQAPHQILTSGFEPLEDVCATLTFPSHEIELARGDLIVRVNRPILQRCVIEPSGNIVDELPRQFIASIEMVFDASGKFPPDSYTVHEQGLEWLVVPPTSPVFVEYRYYSAFEFLGQTDNGLPAIDEDRFLPTTGALRPLSERENILI